MPDSVGAVEVRRARDAREVEEALALRIRVFTDEQGVDREADADGLDGEALHFVAVEDGRVLGTCRVVMRDGVARLGRMVVDRAVRGRGVGARLLDEAERAARAEGAGRVRLHAQVTAQPFYARGGYEQVGEPFVEEAIDHVTMERALA